MIQIATFEVYNDVSSMHLVWELTLDSTPTTETISIYRSEDGGEPNSLSGFDLVAENVKIVDGQYDDTSVNGLVDFHRQWFYKLALTDGTLLTSTSSYVKNLITDNTTKEVIRRKRMSLKFSGRTFYLIKRRSWGTHCSKCWDETLFRSSDPNCDICYGTGWTGGYFGAHKFIGTATVSPKYNQITMFGEWKPSDSLLYTLNYPIFKYKDVVVDDNNRRWIVVQVRPIEKLGYIMEQQVQMAAISPDDKIYSFNL